MRKPKPLCPGSTIRLITPASPLSPDRVEKMVALLESEGYKTQIAPNAFAKLGMFAGSDEQRSKDLQDAFEDPEVDAVLCTRGGYGCSRIVGQLDMDRIAGSGKSLIGFSDITVLQLALMRRQVASIYAPMGATFSEPREPWVYESFKEAIKGGNPIPQSAPKGQCLVPGQAQGVLTGGCLILVCDSIATADRIDARERILLLEDVDSPTFSTQAFFRQQRGS